MGFERQLRDYGLLLPINIGLILAMIDIVDTLLEGRKSNENIYVGVHRRIYVRDIFQEKDSVTKSIWYSSNILRIWVKALLKQLLVGIILGAIVVGGGGEGGGEGDRFEINKNNQRKKD